MVEGAGEVEAPLGVPGDEAPVQFCHAEGDELSERFTE